MLRLRTAMVLSGGAARGAYEAGIISYLRDELEPELGRPLPLDILAGTSVGAINACFLAASAADPAAQGKELCARWKELRVQDILTFGAGDVIRVFRDLTRRAPPPMPPDQQVLGGGLVNPQGLHRMVRKVVRWPNIEKNVRAGKVQALSVSCTRIATGQATVFVQRNEKTPVRSQDLHYRTISTRIGPLHALASAAIPLLFPAVEIDGELYADGGLRQNVPLSPALRLGAHRVIVVSLRKRPVSDALSPGGEKREASEPASPSERAYPSAAFLLGKTLNALMQDTLDEDLHRLRKFNAVLEAGTIAYGPSFEEVLAQGMKRSQPMRWIRNILVHPSEDLGALAAEYARSEEFRKRSDNFVGRILRRFAESEARDRADLVSYLLFDGGFAEILIDLGRRDARARREEWLRFFSDEPESQAEAVQFERYGWGRE